MQNTLEYKKTEKFAIEEAEREAVWQEKYATKIDDVIKKMDYLLQIGTLESRLKLHDMFLHKEFFEHYKQTDTIAVMYVIMQIYERELQNQYTPTILEYGNTVADLVEHLQKLKFILYRVDFGVDKKSEQELIDFIKKNQISVITLETMLTTVAMRPMQLSLKMENIFDKNIMYKQLFWIRNFINDRWSGNHRIIYRLAELYDKTGHTEYAKECMLQIPENLQLLYQKNKMYLNMQEYIWKLRYKDMTVLNNIIKMCLSNDATVKIWKLLLEEIGVDSEEYYLILANEFLENKMVDYAVETLSVGGKIVPQNMMIDKIYRECQRLMGSE